MAPIHPPGINRAVTGRLALRRRVNCTTTFSPSTLDLPSVIMPAYNVTIDDSSALIQYTTPNGNAWTDSPTTDAELGFYWDSTYHSAAIYQATATLQFEGTAVYLYAAKRSRHGPYLVYMDGKLDFNGTGYSLVSEYKQVMYSAEKLTPGWHNLTLVNNDPTSQTYTEVDYVVWTTTMNSSLTEVEGTAIPNNPGNMTYSSTAAWSEETDSEPTMVTSTLGASVAINFTGNGIALYGKTGANFGLFSAQVDNYQARQLNSFSQQTHSTILFRQDSLPDGNHTLVVTNRGSNSLSIGSAVPIIWTSESNNSTAHPNPSPAPAHKTNIGVLVGAIAGGVVVLAAFLLLLLWILRRRRRNQPPSNDSGDFGRATPAFIHTTPFVLPPSPTAAHSTSNLSRREGKFPDESGMLVTSAIGYRAVPGSPGLSSRGSFEVYGPGQGSSSGGTSSAGWASAAAGPAWRGKERRPTGLTTRQEVVENDQESRRDRDAGPVILPQLPPAYSAAAASLPRSSAPGSPIPDMLSLGLTGTETSTVDAHGHTPVSRT